MAIRFDADKQVLSLSVRDVAEAAGGGRSSAGLFGARRSELGMQAHDAYRGATRGGRTNYAAERSVRLERTIDGCVVRISGRVDAVYEQDGALVVEEIKSAAMPADPLRQTTAEDFPHYVMQLAIYRFLLEESGERVSKAVLAMVSILDGAHHAIDIAYDREAVEQWIVDRAREFLYDARKRHAHLVERRGEAATLAFPFERMTTHQEKLLDEIDGALGSGRQLLLCAPTGSGKTAAALFGAVRRAWPTDCGVFYVTGRNTQQQIVLETARLMRARGSCVTAVQVRSRESMCVDESGVCDPEQCRFLRDFRAKVIERDLFWTLIETHGVIDWQTVVERAEAAGVCPFEVALGLSERVDVVTCDYNFVFDPKAFIRRHFGEGARYPFVLIVDEAHNLYGRVREAYSPEIDRASVRELTRLSRGKEGFFWTGLAKWTRSMGSFFSRTARTHRQEAGVADFAVTRLDVASLERRHRKLEDLILVYLAQEAPKGRKPGADPVLDFYYGLGYFNFVAAMDGDEFSHLVMLRKRREAIRVLCKDPARIIAERLGRFAGVVGMSATLEPGFFFKQVLGMNQDAVFASFPSPFPPENRRVLVAPRVSTRYRDRERSAGRVAEVIRTVATSRIGNYMVFFPSFAYLRMLRDLLDGPFDVMTQGSAMDSASRDAVLARLAARAEARPMTRSAVLLAVQGGIFAEGVDYPGEMLCGAVVVGPGLPKVGIERELMREYYEWKYGEGFHYAYLYPGINRVIQSAGRVIRSASDRGVIVLVGSRFAQPTYATLFPEDWKAGPGKARVCPDLGEELKAFWRNG